jgi:formylglycine-generating enzyme required for sulfatase activity
MDDLMITRPKILIVSEGGVLGNVISTLNGGDILSYVNVYSHSAVDLEGGKIFQLAERPSIILLENYPSKERARIHAYLKKSVFVDIPIIHVETTTPLKKNNILRIIAAAKGNIKNKIHGKVDGKEMLLVPAGKYKRRRGLSPTYSTTDGLDQVESHTGTFYIDKYPVTNAEYEQFILAVKYLPPQHWEDGRFPPAKGDHPVTGVNWNDVLEYAKWANKRIPSTDEWEKAAFGIDGTNYPWGDDFDANKCNVLESKQGGTTPVGFSDAENSSSYFGLSDLIGNVWEWVYDWTESTDNRMLMGGSWDTPIALLNAPYYARVRANALLRGRNFGFRLVVPLEMYLMK